MRFDFLHRKALAVGTLTLVAVSSALMTGRVQAQGGDRGRGNGRLVLENHLTVQIPDAMPGEAIVRLAPGVNATHLAQGLGIEVKRKLRFAPNTYVLRGIQGDLGQALAAIRGIPGVLLASTNATRRWHGFPTPPVTNDPLRGFQFPLRTLGANNFWGITVGERFVNGPRRPALVAVLDSAFELGHEDLSEIFSPRSFDFGLDQLYDDSDGLLALLVDPHGQQMSGCVAVANNNGVGLTGLPYEGVNILGCRISDLIVDAANNNQLISVITTANEVDAIYYCIQENVDVISMSFGGRFGDPLERQALSDAYNQGIVLCASAGNSRGFSGFSPGISFPAAYDQVIAVGASGPFGELAFYSDTGPELEVLAPGGNDPTGFDPAREVLSTTESSTPSFVALLGGINNFPTGYEFGQGTSQACAYLAGVIGTLITQGILDESLAPPEQVERVRQILRRTARSGGGGRTDTLGFGLIDPTAALREFSPAIDVISPDLNQVTESFAEPVQASVSRPELARVPPLPGDPNPIRFNNPRPLGNYTRQNTPISAADFSVSVNGDDRTADAEILDPASGRILFEPTSTTRYGIGNNILDISVAAADDPTSIRQIEGATVFGPNGRVLIPARSYQFRVFPRVESPGLKMISLPYALQTAGGADDLNFVYGGNLVRLARFLPDENRYAIFDASGSPQEPEAALTTGAAGVVRPPIGVGFWARVERETQTQILGRSERSPFYRVPLRPGFNMVGNPYSFRVPLQVCNIQFGTEILPITEAVARNLVRNTIWRFESGRYSFKALPEGEFMPFESHWIRAFRAVDLIIPRVPSALGNVANAGAIEPEDDVRTAWSATIQASTRGAVGAEVQVGQSRNARNGPGNEDVENPPPAPGDVDLRVIHSDWGRLAGRYARDVRDVTTPGQEWKLELETFRPGTVVKLTWNGVPPGVRGYIQVNGAAERRALDSGSDMKLLIKRAGVQRLTLRTRSGA